MKSSPPVKMTNTKAPTSTATGTNEVGNRGSLGEASRFLTQMHRFQSANTGMSHETCQKFERTASGQPYPGSDKSVQVGATKTR